MSEEDPEKVVERVVELDPPPPGLTDRVLAAVELERAENEETSTTTASGS